MTITTATKSRLPKSRLPKYCVYQHGWTEGYRDMGVGDGITAPSRLLIATCDTAEEAESLRERIRKASETKTGPLVSGSGNRLPVLASGKFDPLTFVGRQNRDEYDGKRLAALVGRLYTEAATRREKLENGNA